MKVLVDVNASGIVAEQFAERGHDVVRVAARNPRMEDEAVLRWAKRERRILVTTDKDFEEMVWQEGKAHCGLLRLENVPRAERKGLLADVLNHHRDDLMNGAIVIASSGRIRIRKSPGSSGEST